MRNLACFIVAIAISGCGSNTTTQPDMPASVIVDMAQIVSACGHPGDKGNSKHIGEFCTMPFGECPGTLLCSSAQNSSLPANEKTYFCTTTCAAAGPDPATCGEDAQCACQGPLCACVPTACLPSMAG
jgi:hypothetical protein